MKSKNLEGKKLMLLGGLRYLLPVIRAAHEEGVKVCTCDYVPGNIAHKYSDEFHNVSVLDKEAVLALARELQIDGIMSFAVDPGVETAAYVAEKLGLNFQGSYESVRILQNKDLFREFLTEHGFRVPKAKGYDRMEDALRDVDYFNWPVIVKPVDSAGSKGVARVDDPKDLETAIRTAVDESHNGRFIIEDFLEKKGFSSDTECFSVDGRLVFCSFSDQRFDDKALNPYTPSAYSWPPTMPAEAQKELRSELQRLCDLLHLRTGIYNVETRLCKNGHPYIMEMSPRGGGNRLAEMLRYACGTDLIRNAMYDALGAPVEQFGDPVYNGWLAEVVLHADEAGMFERLDVSDELASRLGAEIVETDLWVEPGDEVKGFNGANNAIGTLVVRFPSEENLEEAMSDIPSWCKVVVK